MSDIKIDWKSINSMHRLTWTKEEEEYLADNWGTKSVTTIAKNLHRSVNAIMVRKVRLGLGPFVENGNYITVNQLCTAFGNKANSYMLKSWVENRGFPMKSKKIVNGRVRVVYLEDFWEWAEKNKSFIDFSKLEENLLGKEPAWVKQQRKHDMQKKIKYKDTPWTHAEDQKLERLLKEFKYTYLDLSLMLRRTSGAIQRRVVDLGLKQRPLKAENHIYWTGEEDECLVNMIKDGTSYPLMAEILNKSDKAIRGHVYRMYMTENLDKARQIIGNGEWGDNRPDRRIFHHTCNETERIQIKNDLSKLAGLLKMRAEEV